MISEGDQFLKQLASVPAETFEHGFAESAGRLNLGIVFDRNDLRLLFEVSLCALSCNMAINGYCGWGNPKAAADERYRTELEHEFMAARDLFYACPGWQNLEESARRHVDLAFLRVAVDDDLLAW